MTSTFRLTRAEFKKIFKRASVYIMALLLVVAVLVSVYLFKPLTTEDKTINYGADLTVENYYDTFFNKDLANSKKGIDTIFDNAENMYNYYSNSSHRELKIEENYNDVILSMNELKSVTDPSLKTIKEISSYLLFNRVRCRWSNKQLLSGNLFKKYSKFIRSNERYF